MTIAPSVPRASVERAGFPLVQIATGVLFLALFWQPMATLARDWWNDPDASHGLLLFPIALYLAWQKGLVANPRPQRALGLAIIGAAVLLRYVSGLAAELFTMRASLLGAVLGLLIYQLGWRQLTRWWLPIILVALSVPVPSVILNSLALPLQLKASALGAALLSSRHIPVLLEGNVLHLPDRSLFVTEACSGLRSLTALMALGVLIGGIWLRTPWARVMLLLIAIPVAMVVNSLRVFLTGFLVYYVDPRLADGFSHYTEGWALFVVAFAALGGVAWVLARIEAARGVDQGDETPTDTAKLHWKQLIPFVTGRPTRMAWAVAGTLAIGTFLTVGSTSADGRPLRMPLGSALPGEVGVFKGRDHKISDAELEVAGVSDYLFRTYTVADAPAYAFSVYVGYYDSQTQGKTIHSPKNCLPGSGWEALQSSTTVIQTASGPATVNRYLIQKGEEKALVLYWYQGRGRIQANEYAVKWNLLRDAALRRRSEEALVRIVVPITKGTDSALELARQNAGTMMGELARSLPT